METNTNKNGTLSERTVVRLSLPTFIGLVVIIVGASLGWGGWITQNRYLLTREEAAKTYVTRAEFKEWSDATEKIRCEQFTNVNANLTSANARLDRILERIGKIE